VIVPIERREENAARGPESARSHIGRGLLSYSNAARRRAAGARGRSLAGPRNARVPRARR